MSDNFVWLLPASLGLSYLIFFVGQHRQPNSKHKLVLYHSPGSCKSRLDRGSSKTILELLHARALPYNFLDDASGIDYAFTTTDVIRYKTFLQCCIELRLHDAEVRHGAKTVLDKFLATPPPSQLDAGFESIAPGANLDDHRYQSTIPKVQLVDTILI